MTLNYTEPIALVDGEGRHVVDAEGRRYLDFFGGILTTSIGYNIPEIVDAVRAQVGKMVHTSTLYLIESQIELAEMIATRSGIVDAKVFFVNSGTEANEAALMFACVARRSNQILALRNSYHGRSFAAVAVTGNRSWSASSLSPFAVSYVHSGYRFRSPFGHLPEDQFIGACVEDLRDVITTTTAGDIAAFIVEPVQGVGGFVVPPDGFFSAMAEVTAPFGIPLISDEVQTGWGRTGQHYWGISHHGVVPDAMTFAKGLANGLPIAGVVARADLVDAVTANSISTFGGNPLVTTAALATLRYIDEHHLVEGVTSTGAALADGLHALARDRDQIGDVRTKGLMAALEFVVPQTTEPDSAVADAVLNEAARRGLLVGKGGLFGNCLRIAPPMSVTHVEISTGVGILGEAIDAVCARNRR
jgi:4-aminobutyrate aminotransferase